MRVALSLSKFYSTIDLTQKPIDELVDRIGSQLGAVEEVISLKEQYAGVLIARIVSCVNHPDSDHLHICMIDDGGKAEGVERDENGHVRVVCGASNVREGLLVAWLPPGSTVPSTYHHDQFVLEARKLRGVVSNGMLASAKELGISDDHEGILEVDEDVQPGTAFAEAYDLNDHIIDIENKMFTHRPDCFGVLGVYREVAGIYHQQFTSPEWYTSDAYSLETEAEILPLEVTNELPELVPRFVMIPMSGIEVKPSPVWMQALLMSAGVRPINNVVDITNYLMYVTGQPLHAYDYDKVKALSGGDAASVTVRYPKKGEKAKLLNGKEIEPRAEAIMITSGDHLIGVGGIMGGSETEVDDLTKNIILECATFDMYSVRRTSMAHGLFTDAVTRFNKGQSPLQNMRIIAKAVHEVRTLANGKVAGQYIDKMTFRGHRDKLGNLVSVWPPVETSVDFINTRLGLQLDRKEIVELLRNVEFVVEDSLVDDKIRVLAPFWRTDIEIPEDVVEEVGRLYGYDHLPLELPKRDLAPVAKDEMLTLKSRARNALARAGANEVLTYTFVHGNLLEKTGQDRDQAFQLSNALSPDLQYFRLSLTPSLLDLVHSNVKAGYDEFALFELNAVYGKSEMDEDGLPKEFARIALVVAADQKIATKSYGGAAYYQARYYLEALVNDFAITDLTYKPLGDVDFSEHKLFTQLLKPFEPKRSAVVFNGKFLVGVVGEYKASVANALKLPAFTAGFELFGSALTKGGAQAYAQLPRFPKVEQDISLKVPADVTYGDLYAFAHTSLQEALPEQTRATLSPVDIYQRPDDAAHKQITLRLTIASFERTLNAEEVNSLLDAVADKAKERFGAERI
jgi:phenylalanyl-tRNA synthetase beta chain